MEIEIAPEIVIADNWPSLSDFFFILSYFTLLYHRKRQFFKLRARDSHRPYYIDICNSNLLVLTYFILHLLYFMLSMIRRMSGLNYTLITTIIIKRNRSRYSSNNGQVNCDVDEQEKLKFHCANLETHIVISDIVILPQVVTPD